MRALWTEQADVVVAAYKVSPEQRDWTHVWFSRKEWGFTLPSRRVAATCARIEDYLAPEDIVIDALRTYAAKLEHGVLGDLVLRETV